MDRKWLVLLLGLSLLGNGVLLVLLMGARAQTGAQALAPPSPTSSPVNRLSETTGAMTIITATTRPRPLVAQSTSTSPAPTATVAPTRTPAATATDAPTETPAPSATPLPSPTPVPETPPSPTVEAAGTDWLQYLNIFRREANLPPLLENPIWSSDSAQHSRYMVLSGDLSHYQDPASPYYTRNGQTAAENGNIAAGYLGSDPFRWAFNYWMSAPFHAIPILDPQLQATGFAEYRDASGAQPVAATLDVRRGLGALPQEVVYPVMFPREGGLTWVLRYSLPEFPEALSTCPGYLQPTGAPIILQIGDGRLVPNVTATSFVKDGEYLAHCRFDETNYTHANEFRQRSARQILDQRDAIVIIPQKPLLPDSTYAVRVDVNGEILTWSFRTAAGPP